MILYLKVLLMMVVGILLLLSPLLFILWKAVVGGQGVKPVHHERQ